MDYSDWSTEDLWQHYLMINLELYRRPEFLNAMKEMPIPPGATKDEWIEHCDRIVVLMEQAVDREAPLLKSQSTDDLLDEMELIEDELKARGVDYEMPFFEMFAKMRPTFNSNWC
jgi:hypothetical protein